MTTAINTINFIFSVVATLCKWFDFLHANVDKAENAIKKIAAVLAMFAGIVAAVILSLMFANVAAAILFYAIVIYLFIKECKK